MLSREDYINQICYRASIIRKNPESPHLDKTELRLLLAYLETQQSVNKGLMEQLNVLKKGLETCKN